MGALSGAQRLRNFRARRANGRAVWMIEGDVVGVERMLEVAMLLPVGVDHSHAEVQMALNKFVDIHVADER